MFKPKPIPLSKLTYKISTQGPSLTGSYYDCYVASFKSTSTESYPVKAKPFSEIPGPRILPWIGTSWQYMSRVVGGKYNIKKLHDAQFDKYKNYGPIVRDKAGTLDMVHLYRPEDVQTVLQLEGKFPSRGDVAAIFQTYEERVKKKPQNNGENVKEWMDQRRKIQSQMLRPASVNYYLSLQGKVADDFVLRMARLVDESGHIPDYDQELFRYTTETIAAVCFDKRLKCFDDVIPPEVEEFMESLDEVFEIVAITMISFPWYKYFRTPLYKKFEKRHAFILSLGRQYTDDCFASIREKLGDNSEPNFLMSLLKSKDLTAEEATNATTALFFAGVESTSKTAACLLYNLTTNPDVLERLVAEVDRVLPNNATMTEASLKKMPYLKACVKESFRMTFPVSFGLVRVLDQDVELSGYTIPAGVMLMANSPTMCKLDEYFPQPMKFIPDRWLRSDTTAASKNNKLASFILTPFGHGPRSCLGRRFAEQELYLLMIKVLQNFTVSSPQENIELINGTFVSLAKCPRFEFTRRS